MNSEYENEKHQQNQRQKPCPIIEVLAQPGCQTCQRPIRRPARPQSTQQEKEASCPEELRHDVVKCEATVMDIRGAKCEDRRSSHCGIFAPRSTYQSINL